MTVLVLIGTLVGVAMAEISLRVLTGMGRMASFRSNVLPLYEATTDGRPFALRANYQYKAKFNCGWTTECEMHVELNDLGLREQRNTSELLSHDFKIMAMGDSFTFGYGVQAGERFSDRLNSILNKKGVAFSVGYADGFSPVDYEVFLRTFYDRFQPNIVIVGLFPENDLVHDVRARVLTRNERNEIVASKLNGMVVIDGFIVQTDRLDWITKAQIKAKNYLWDTFAFYRLLEEGRNQIRFKLHPEKKAEYLPRLLFGEDPESERSEVSTTLAAIKSMDQYLKSRDGRLIVLHVPSAFQISHRYDRIYTRPGFRVDPHLAEQARRLLEPQTRFGRWFRENDILYVDPTALLRAQDREDFKTYFDSDGHWSPLGHQIAFSVLARFLLDGGLIPEDYRAAHGEPIMSAKTAATLR
jgi:hypothetical protein